jgi:uncharacterized protein with NRDE domain
MCNRDERRTRPRAAAPLAYRAGNYDAVFPRDPVGGGTWIGANTAGLAVAILNRNDDACVRRPPWELGSRGRIPVALFECGSINEVLESAGSLRANGFAPFRLLALRDHRAAIVSSNGRTLEISESAFDTPLLLTSSSYGDEWVGKPRRALFEQMVMSSEDGWLAGQMRFHGHQWPDRRATSVLMERRDAVTVSRSTVDVTQRGVRFRYEALPQMVGAA